MTAHGFTAGRRWDRIDSAPENVEVLTMICDAAGERNVQALVRKGRLWFYPDMSMYVYYTPTHWCNDAAAGRVG